MSPKLPPKKAALYDRIDEILWSDWDPIGCNEHETARDEYHSYLSHVFFLAIEGSDTYKISKFLHECETINMGLVGNKKRCDAIAVLICSERDKAYPRALPITIGSNRSLRSLGRAKARPLTKR